MNDTRSNVRINGDGSVAGGVVGAVTINGAGTVGGDIDATTFRVNGAGTANGNVKAEHVKVNGTATFQGEVHAQEFVVNGDASVQRGLGAGRLTVKGNLRVGGGVAANDVDLGGMLKIGGDCEAESFTGEGLFEIAGLLNAGRIDVRVYGRCSAREIGGESITVREGRRWLGLFGDRKLVTDVIEGDDISLEYVEAKVVRGRNVTVGAGCSIGLVEYSENYSRFDGASVGESRKTEVAE